jgi:hypothetical protein
MQDGEAERARGRESAWNGWLGTQRRENGGRSGHSQRRLIYSRRTCTSQPIGAHQRPELRPGLQHKVGLDPALAEFSPIVLEQPTHTLRAQEPPHSSQFFSSELRSCLAVRLGQSTMHRPYLRACLPHSLVFFCASCRSPWSGHAAAEVGW